MSTAWPILNPRPAQAQPRWVSRIWPTFIRLGTPNGLSTISTCVPSARNGMSSTGTIFDTTPLLPWRPAILSPGWILRFTATNTLTIFITPDGERALVLLDPVAIEHAHLDHGALHARRHAQRGVAHVGGLLAEDRAQELLFRRHRAFALRRDLAAEDVAGAHLRADVDDARLVEVLERLFRDVRDVAGDFLGSELGVAGHHLEFLDMD